MKAMATNGFSVLIPDGESWLTYSVLNCLGQIPGVKVNILAPTQCNPNRFSKYTGRYVNYPPTDDPMEKLAVIQAAIKTTRSDVVLPIDIETIRLLSEHRGALPGVCFAPMPEVGSIDIAANKWLLAQWLMANHFPCPQTLLYSASPDFIQALGGLSFPVLLKPTQQIDDVAGFSGRGIESFDCIGDLLDFCQAGSATEYIVQPFLKGYDMGCNVLCIQGKILAYTIQQGFMPSSVLFEPAAGVDFTYNPDVCDLISNLVSRLNWTGVANIDLRYDEVDQQIKILEINPRFWRSLLGSCSAGVNFPYLSCLSALGQDVPAAGFTPQRYVNARAAVSMLSRNLIGGRQSAQRFDGSELDFILKDPVPKGIEYCFNAYRKLVPIK